MDHLPIKQPLGQLDNCHAAQELDKREGERT